MQCMQQPCNKDVCVWFFVICRQHFGLDLNKTNLSICCSLMHKTHLYHRLN